MDMICGRELEAKAQELLNSLQKQYHVLHTTLESVEHQTFDTPVDYVDGDSEAVLQPSERFAADRQDMDMSVACDVKMQGAAGGRQSKEPSSVPGAGMHGDVMYAAHGRDEFDQETKLRKAQVGLVATLLQEKFVGWVSALWGKMAAKNGAERVLAAAQMLGPAGEAVIGSFLFFFLMCT